MEPQHVEKVSKPAMVIVKSVVISFLILMVGILGMTKLASLKKPPAETKVVEQPLRVETQVVKPENVPVLITSYGETAALNVVSISPEVSGKIVAIHPRLEAGETVAQGDILFQIDPRDYLTVIKTSRKRLKILKRNHELAKKEYERVRVLLEKNSVGTQTGVEAAEKTMLSAADLTSQIAQVLETAETNLDRCVVRAPFNARIKSVSLEKGQYVAPGQHIITLADDSVLEIHVPLDSRDARKWLRFKEEKAGGKFAWFSGLEPVACTVRWTEDNNGQTWKGRLHRVVEFDRQTRTLTVAVRIDANDALAVGQGTMPLVEGMFCLVQIPGKILQNVFRIPRQAVSFENTVYTMDKHRLKTAPVNVARLEGEYAYISGGLHPGDTIVTTRLIDPLENSLLESTTTRMADGLDFRP